MIIAVIWILLSFVVATVGNEKKIGYWGVFWISVLLSPVIGIIIGLVSAPKDKQLENQELAHNYRRAAHKDVEQENFESAVENLNKANSLMPNNGSILFDISCVESLSGNTEPSLFYLKKAIENGFTKINLILEDKELENLRQTGAYKAFINELISGNNSSSANTTEEKLNELKQLLDKGLISGEEYNHKRKKILDDL
ncbi:MAG: SHOCT domain-containing protein [Chitinophagales bacterium]|nr:SHOCT domain-containing protein [Chitinophagales bacterium]